MTSALIAGAVSAMLVLANVKSSPEILSPVEHPRPFILLDVMHQFQRYADKIYFSGSARNQELSAWYMWKLEQSARQVINHETIPWYPPKVDEIQLLKAMLLPPIKNLNVAVKNAQWQKFPQLYQQLVNACNACHIATEHAFVKIQIPQTPIYSNQKYTLLQ